MVSRRFLQQNFYGRDFLVALEPFVQFTVPLKANDLPNEKPFKINCQALTGSRFEVEKATAAPIRQDPAQKYHFAAGGTDDGSAIFPASTSASEI